MIAYLLSRIGQGLVVVAGAALVAFLLLRFTGDPVDNMMAQEATSQQREAMRSRLGLDAPVAQQFARFIGRAAEGDFGISLQLRRPVGDLILERLPATVELVVFSALLAALVGVPLGLLAGVEQQAVCHRFIQVVSLAGISLPTFVIGTWLIFIFPVGLGMLPSFGRGDVVAIGWWTTGLLTTSGRQALILPVVTLATFQVALIIRLLSAEMRGVMRTDYIRFARSRGLPERKVFLWHVLPNALVPVITIICLNVGALIAFSIVTETVFQWPGLGTLLIEAVVFADAPVIAAYLVLAAIVFVCINFLADVLCRVIDPRLRESVAGRGQKLETAC